MKKKMRVYYDKKADFLEISSGKPTKSYYKDIGKDIFERIDERTGKIKGFAIFNFKKRAEKLKEIEIPLHAKMQVVS